MNRTGLALVLAVASGVALWPGGAGADGFKGSFRAVRARGHVNSLDRSRAVVPRAFLFRHPSFHRPSMPPWAVGGPELAPAPPVVVTNILIDPGGPADRSADEAPPAPVQPKMIVVNPGPTRDWCWDKTTWSWVATCP